jgi:hypothetical protein
MLSNENYQPLELLTSESLLQIRTLLASNNQFAAHDLVGLKKEFMNRGEYLEFFQSTIQLDTLFELSSEEQDLKKQDLDNTLRIFRAFRNLDPALATDERLWATLALREFHTYSISRWLPEDSKDKQKYKYFTGHVLTSTSRDRWRGQSVARLWWVANFRRNLDEAMQDKFLEVYYFNSDLGQQFLGKPSLSLSKKLASAIIEVVYENLLANSSVAWDRNKFRTFMKRLDLLVGRRKMEAVDEVQLKREISQLFVTEMK